MDALEMNTSMDEHDKMLVEQAKHMPWEHALHLMDDVHSEEAYWMINDYCKSEYHKYED